MDDFTVTFDWAEYYKGQIEWDKGNSNGSGKTLNGTTAT